MTAARNVQNKQQLFCCAVESTTRLESQLLLFRHANLPSHHFEGEFSVNHRRPGEVCLARWAFPLVGLFCASEPL